MNIAITGASGLVGSNLVETFQTHHQITRVNRSLDLAAQIENQDVIIHLAGEGIANRRWSVEQKEKIRQSRVLGTKNLVDTLSKLNTPPKLLINASAIGFYGDRPGESLDETSSQGAGFLAETVEAWEREAIKAKTPGVRVICLRFGLVLSGKGGALKKMLLPFKLGLGGSLGDGTQMMSWISNDEIPSIILFLMEHESLSGPVNAVSPMPSSNKDFTKTLAKVLKRPAVLPAPKFVLKAVLGEMAEELLFASQHVLPKKLRNAGYHFQYPNLEKTLLQILS